MIRSHEPTDAELLARSRRRRRGGVSGSVSPDAGAGVPVRDADERFEIDCRRRHAGSVPCAGARRRPVRSGEGIFAVVPVRDDAQPGASTIRQAGHARLDRRGARRGRPARQRRGRRPISTVSWRGRRRSRSFDARCSHLPVNYREVVVSVRPAGIELRGRGGGARMRGRNRPIPVAPGTGDARRTTSVRSRIVAGSVAKRDDEVCRMTCESFNNIIHELATGRSVEGRLETDARSHAQECHACSVALDEQRRLTSLLGARRGVGCRSRGAGSNRGDGARCLPSCARDGECRAAALGGGQSRRGPSTILAPLDGGRRGDRRWCAATLVAWQAMRSSPIVNSSSGTGSMATAPTGGSNPARPPVNPPRESGAGAAAVSGQRGRPRRIRRVR